MVNESAAMTSREKGLAKISHKFMLQSSPLMRWWRAVELSHESLNSAWEDPDMSLGAARVGRPLRLGCPVAEMGYRLNP